MTYRIANEPVVQAKVTVVPVAPTDDSLTKIMALAKMANVTLYPGSACGPFYLEVPPDEADAEAMFELGEQAGLVFWEPILGLIA
jgi:hypothetical protein